MVYLRKLKKNIYILTGKVTQIYDDSMGTKMTAITEDKPCKRAYLGIIQVNYEI